MPASTVRVSLAAGGMLVAGLLSIVTAPAASAKPTRVQNVRLNGFEARLLADMNATRKAHHLPALHIAAGSTDVARRWTWHLAGQKSLEHNPKLVGQLAAHGSGNWHVIEENVGYGPSGQPDTLFNAYMNSPEHKANILGKGVRYVGVGVVDRDGYAYNTVDFVSDYSHRYGATRVPADGLAMDDVSINGASVLATAKRADQRFGSAATGQVTAAALSFSHGTARTVLRASNHGTAGRGQLIFREGMSISAVSTLRLALSAVGHTTASVPVRVSLSNGWTSTDLGVIRAGRALKSAALPIPVSALGQQSTVTLSVSRAAIRRAGGQVSLNAAQLQVS